MYLQDLYISEADDKPTLRYGDQIEASVSAYIAWLVFQFA